MDLAEIRELYEKFGAALKRRAMQMVKNEETAMEILQDVFMAAIKNANSFKNESKPYTWLYRITTNHCLNYLQKHKRLDLMDEVPDSFLQALPENNNQSQGCDFQKFFKNLKKEEQQIFIYRFQDDLKQEEIAGLMEISRKTVYLRLEKIMEKYKKFFSMD